MQGLHTVQKLFPSTKASRGPFLGLTKILWDVWYSLLLVRSLKSITRPGQTYKDLKECIVLTAACL